MRIFELIEKLNKVNRDNFIFMKIGKKKHYLDGNTDDIGDLDLYAVDKEASKFRFVKNLLNYLKENDPKNEAFLQGPNNMSYHFTGLKYDRDANVVVYVKKGDVPA